MTDYTKDVIDAAVDRLHPDDKFRLNECKQCKVLLAELEKATAVAVMYRDQIKVYQQHSGGPLWSGQREATK